MRRWLARIMVLTTLVAGCDVDSFPSTVDSAGWQTDGRSAVFSFVKHNVYWDQPPEAWSLVRWPEMEQIEATVRSTDASGVEVEASGLEPRWYAVRLAPEEAGRLGSTDSYALADGSYVWFRDLGFVAEPESITSRTSFADMLVTFTAPFVAADGGPVTGYVSLTQAATSCENAEVDGVGGRHSALLCDRMLDFSQSIHLTVREGLITQANGVSVPPLELDFVADQDTGFYRFETAARPLPPVPTELCHQPDLRHICE